MRRLLTVHDCTLFGLQIVFESAVGPVGVFVFLNFLCWTVYVNVIS